MVRFLVEHGACIFATTISDQETAAEKCEEEEEGFESCSDYLYSKYKTTYHWANILPTSLQGYWAFSKFKMEHEKQECCV